jgi:hypothetical protein
LAEGLRKGITEYQLAKDAVIALIPETANNKQPVWANAWKIATGKWKKENGDSGNGSGVPETPHGTGGKTEYVNAETVETPPNNTVRRVEVAGRPSQGDTNITIVVPQGGVGSGTPLLPGGKVTEGVGVGKSGDGKVKKPSGKDLYEFIKPLIKGGICYEALRNATEKWNSKANAVLLETVKGTILDMQKDFMPGKLIKSKLKTDFGTEFTDFVDGIGALTGPNGGMLKGWERQNLPVISGKQPSQTTPQGTQNVSTPPGNSPVSASVPPGNNASPQPSGPVSAPSPTLQWSPELHSLYQTAWNMTVQEDRLYSTTFCYPSSFN